MYSLIIIFTLMLVWVIKVRPFVSKLETIAWVVTEAVMIVIISLFEHFKTHSLVAESSINLAWIIIGLCTILITVLLVRSIVDSITEIYRN